MNLPKAYEPSQYEPNIYAMWETSGAFAPSGHGDPYSIVMPPPNANANLHVGHAYMIPLQDILIRFHRMHGRDTIWIPGADHAGFETWVVFEKMLEKQGQSRFDFSREKLYNMVWDFVEENRGNMELQLRALGASCDWNSLVFALDEKVIKAVYQTFKRLWDDGLVYRGERIVNYCTFHQTSFADIEVVHREEQGKLWHVAYPLTDGSGQITVATTRPETMLGDVAIAVHPDDARYRDLVGRTVKLPVVGREISIIADDAVEKDFGTGAVKITPAHDPLDFEIGQRHDLPLIQVIGYDGLITDQAPAEFVGLDAADARHKIVAELKTAGQLVKTESYKHQVPHCYRCDNVIQPLVKDQWFIKVRPLAEHAQKTLEKNQIKFAPAAKKAELIRYFDELRDWNISRQIPWGIPIPAFQNEADPNDWIFDTRVDELVLEVDGKTYRRDNDTFDTWFSSGQWPFITTDYMKEGRAAEKTSPEAARGGLQRFYPTSVMETGVDLLRPWVARMIMLGLYATDEIPFRDVIFHGLVLDERGQKMSMSKGNVINPMDVINEFGSDALRMGIVMNRSLGQNQAFSTATVVAGRNFCNKLWNMARFIEKAETDNVGRKSGDQPAADITKLSLADHWALRQLHDARRDIRKLLKQYRFAEAAETIYHVIWDDIADWYIEASKAGGNPEQLSYVLDGILKIAHPFAPFVTEAIWTTRHEQDAAAGLLITQNWDFELKFDALAAAEFDRVRELVNEIRYVAASLGQGKPTLLFLDDSLIADNAALIKSLAQLADVKSVAAPRGLRIAAAGREAYLDVDEATLYEHQTRLEERLVKTRQMIDKLKQRLANSGYVDRAPTHLVEETRRELAEYQAQARRLAAELDVIKK
jgi:valyl-tRNA synthetase